MAAFVAYTVWAADLSPLSYRPSHPRLSCETGMQCTSTTDRTLRRRLPNVVRDIQTFGRMVGQITKQILSLLLTL